MKYQVFISYRRETGESLAQLLYYRFNGDGYSTFFDVETMRSGKFNAQIYNVIDECSDFILILSEKSLDRSINPNDWVRLEIEHALKTKKNIIPVFGRNFNFPDSLPSSIEQIKFYQGVTANSEFFDATIDKIESLMVSRPVNSGKEDSPEKKNFSSLLLDMYHSLAAYREAVRRNDLQEVSRLSGPLQNSAQQIYLFYEYNQFVDKNNAEKAKKIIDLYNEFIDYFRIFISFPPGESRSSAVAQDYAEKTESTFKSLIALVLKYLAETSKE